MRLTVSAVLKPLMGRLKVAESAPVAVGLNSTEKVQLAPAASVDPQVEDNVAKELALVPVMLDEPRVMVAVPLFLRVMVEAAEVEPTLVEAKAIDVGERVTDVFGVLVGQALTRLVTFGVPRPVVRS